MSEISAEQQKQFEPLGRQLKRITEESKSALEIKAITEILTKAAHSGENYCTFSDLRAVVPNMILNGTLNKWLADNELIPQGQINQNNGNYEYTISW